MGHHEVGSFCYSTQKNIPPEREGEFDVGDVWTWTAIDAETTPVPSWLVGNRDATTASFFVYDLADHLANRVQLTTDGPKLSLEAVEEAFGGDIDSATLSKRYGSDPEADKR